VKEQAMSIPWERVTFIADLHIHSKYSRATSPEMVPERLNEYAKKKGITVMGTGDFTHPLYLKELREGLEPGQDGFLHLKNDPEGTRFVLTVEVSNIFTWHGKVRRIHTVIVVPSFKAAQEIQDHLGRIGNISSDGRPIFGFPAKELVKIVREATEDFLVIPAHVWTPWFSLFGAKSGFDSIEECFEEETEHIFALETGLSSDPPMNWRLSALDRYTLVSNSDAHSPQKIGREINCFSCGLTYREMVSAIRDPEKGFVGTIEFFPEEGKYHYDGHRACGVCLSPEETRQMGGLCPVCGRPLTVGVLHRVEELADRPNGTLPEGALPFVHLVPLDEIIQEALGLKSFGKRVKREYERVIEGVGNELDVLVRIPLEDLKGVLFDRLIEGIHRVRQGKVSIRPGHDGEYGTIRVLDKEEERKRQRPHLSLHQKSLF